jgi:hypothetical protein
MPYIKSGIRAEIDKYVDGLATKLLTLGNVKGDLNYAITRLIHLHIKSVGLRYSNLSDVVGVLEDIKAEFNRTIVAPYEKQKIRENGKIGILPIEGE